MLIVVVHLPSTGASAARQVCRKCPPGPQFWPILIRRRDHARDHGWADRAALFAGLIQRAERQAP